MGCSSPQGHYKIYTREILADSGGPITHEQPLLYDTHYGERPQIKKYIDKQVLCYDNQCIPFPLNIVITILEE